MKVLFRLLALINVLVYLLATGSGIALGLAETPGFQFSFYSLHFKLALLAAILTLFIHSIVMIYLIVTHKAVKEGLEERDLTGETFHKRMRALKMETLPWTTTGMLVMIGATILGAATDTHHLPQWTHTPTMVVAMGLNIYLFFFTYDKLNENTDLLQEANQTLLAHDEDGSGSPEPERKEAETPRESSSASYQS